MAAPEEGDKPGRAFSMNGGNYIHSYTKNSYTQRIVGDSMKSLMDEVIAEKLDMTTFSTSSAFRIVDLGCSVGPNTFIAVQHVVEAIEKTVEESQSRHKNPEFQVFFNDQTANDFNTLFRSLPINKSYYAAGVPGSFYGRLFPDSYIHFAYSSCALHYVSRIPEEHVQDHVENPVAWNKGRIYYSHASDKVALAYSNQHAEDMHKFLQARADEIVCGGLMLLLVPARPNGISHSEHSYNKYFHALELCLVDMVKKEIEEGIPRNGRFSVERNESLPNQIVHLLRPQQMSTTIRAAVEGLIEEHFGFEIMDELFQSFTKKLEDGFSDIIPGRGIDLFVLLKRKAD